MGTTLVQFQSCSVCGCLEPRPGFVTAKAALNSDRMKVSCSMVSPCNIIIMGTTLIFGNCMLFEQHSAFPQLMTFYIYATPMKSWASYVVGRQDKRAWHASTRDFLMTKMREVGLISPTGVKKLDASFSRELLLSFWHHQKLHPQDI